MSYTVINCNDTKDYCPLNISWYHPLEQNGEIKSFHIDLVELGTNKGLNNMYIVEQRQYKPRYFSVVLYLPYATTYNISIWAVNDDFQGEKVTFQAKIDHIEEHIDQIHNILEVSHDSFLVQNPALDVRINKAVLTVIVQSAINKHIDKEMWEIENQDLCFEVADTWIAKVLEFSTSGPITFVIGDGKTEFSQVYNRSIENKVLLPDTDYCLTYVVNNTYKNINHTKVYHQEKKTLILMEDKSSNYTLKVVMILLTLLVLLIISVLILFRYRHKLYCRKVRQDGEHIYEAMPFEDTEDVPNVVYNVAYDKLIHV